MKKEHLDILCCPNSRESLELQNPVFHGDEIISGLLVSGVYEYAIRNGIPRFVDNEGYSDNFGWQWNKWARVQFEDENIGGPMEGYTRTMFKKITEFTENKIKNKVVLDIGCGPGRFIDIVLEMGGTPIAVDYSSAIDAAKNNFKNRGFADNRILFIQGDALNLPLRDGAVDYSYSIGVLHHTPSPEQGIFEAFRVTKSDGEFAISLYPKDGYYTLPIVQIWRKFFKLLWPAFGPYPPLMYSNIFCRINHFLCKFNKRLGFPLRIFFPSITLPDLRWSILDTFDSITPSYQSGHEIYTMYIWFINAGFSKVRPGVWGANLIGKKSAHHSMINSINHDK